MNIIEDGFRSLLNEIPALEINVSSALAGVRASWDRSFIGERRLAAAARHSIAVYIAGVVAAAFLKGTRSEAEYAAMGRLLRHAETLGASASSRHLKNPDYEPRKSWEGPPGGPWNRTVSGQWNLTLLHSPNMPGGKWTIAIGDTPCLYGDEPEEVEGRTLDLLAGIARAERAAMLRASSRSSAFRQR